ncbi:hypothetical protein [Azomonas macrocytogenes]|uniref:Uncharacterized protein n=1 Tax=Azomonas macrocytogenes TaxID=69962 RepID=A0A839T7Y3_AZOMA|nr:hypothetical protein [Azomonas macrocytogenes]MBB3103773.1 hypothetical protein [Azomonas macrocytogenes]
MSADDLFQQWLLEQWRILRESGLISDATEVRISKFEEGKAA